MWTHGRESSTRIGAVLARLGKWACEHGPVRNTGLPKPGEDEVESPDGQIYAIRVSGAGVQRANFFNLLPSIVSGLAWTVRRRKRWQVEVFQSDRFGVTYPPVLREDFDDLAAAEARVSALIAQLGAGQLGWDRWQLPLRGPEPSS